MKNIFKKIIASFFYFFGYKILKLDSRFSFPVTEIKEDIKQYINVASNYSMTGYLRMYVLSEAIRNIHEKSIKGDFVETGVWRGGNLILMRNLMLHYNLSNSLFAYDTFEGMPSPTEYDVDINNSTADYQMSVNKRKSYEANIHCYASLKEVKHNIFKEAVLKKINFIKGKVEDTLLIERNLPNKISLLRLDTDFYESTKTSLEILYPRLVSGGILFIDDYGHWKGARKAVDEYFKNNKWLHVVDHTCRYIIKE